MSEQEGVISHDIIALNIDTCIIVTGPAYDRLIEKTFPDARFLPLSKNFSVRQLALVDLGIENGPRAVRTYHPNYLNRWGNRKIKWGEIKSELFEFVLQLD